MNGYPPSPSYPGHEHDTRPGHNQFDLDSADTSFYRRMSHHNPVYPDGVTNSIGSEYSPSYPPSRRNSSSSNFPSTSNLTPGYAAGPYSASSSNPRYSTDGSVNTGEAPHTNANVRSKSTDRRRSSHYHGPRRKKALLLGIRFGWVVLVIWGEIGEFFSSISECHFPDSQLSIPSSSYSSSGKGKEKSLSSSRQPKIQPTHVLLISDPQIPHPTLSYPSRNWLLQKITTWFIDLYMRKSWRVIMRLGRIDTVIVGGDMMDWGRGVFDDEEYKTYLNRFKSIFKLPPGVEMHFVPGNHDLGLGPNPLFSPRSKERYAENFTPPNALLSVANHTIILLDAVSLVEEDYRRYAAEVQLGEWEGVRGGVIEFIKALGEHKPPGPRILISHIPLARPELSTCGPLRERGRILKGAGIGYQNLLGSETSRFLLNNVEPSVIFSGDDHDYCEYVHPNGVREVTLKAFSMAMGIQRPGFQLLSLVPPSPVPEVHTSMVPQKTFADVPCLLPDQFEIYWRHYIPFAILSVLVLFWYNLRATVNKNGGWTAVSTNNVKQFLSPAPTPQSQFGNHAKNRYPSRKEKSLPLTLPSRKSAQNLSNLHMSSATPDHLALTARLSVRTPSLTPVRKFSKSVPVSPSDTPKIGPSPVAEEYDAERNCEGGLYANSNSSRSHIFSDLSIKGHDVESGARTPVSAEPSTYFLDLPDHDHPGFSSSSGPNSGANTPGLYMSPRRSASTRRMTRPSDWVSAAKAKDMTVVELMLQESPGVGRFRRWLGMDKIANFSRWMSGRRGVLASTMRDIWQVLWPTVLVWIAINAMFSI